jgi:hypothetical protein
VAGRRSIRSRLAPQVSLSSTVGRRISIGVDASNDIRRSSS